MPVVSVSVIWKPRRPRHCYRCSDLAVHQPIEGPIVRLYGNADDPDPKYVIYCCVKHAMESTDPRVESFCAIMKGDLLECH